MVLQTVKENSVLQYNKQGLLKCNIISTLVLMKNAELFVFSYLLQDPLTYYRLRQQQIRL